MARLLRPSEIHSYLLSPAGFRRVRAALTGKYRFLSHRTLFDNLASIVEEGLKPHDVNATFDFDNRALRAAMNGTTPDVLCFAPFGKSVNCSGHGARVQLAIAATALPSRIGIDWSVGGAWRKVEEDLRSNPALSAEELFLENVRFTDCLVTYDVVAVGDIRAFARGSDFNSPASWPYLAEVSDYEALKSGGS